LPKLFACVQHHQVQRSKTSKELQLKLQPRKTKNLPSLDACEIGIADYLQTKTHNVY
jgi:hypothetical protein